MSRQLKSKVLIKRKYGHLGDILMTTPVIEAVKKKYGLPIDYALPKEYEDALYNNPNINEVIDISNINENTYMKIIDLSDYEFNYAITHQPIIEKNKIELFLECANMPSTSDKRIKIYLSDKEKAFGKDFINRTCQAKKKTIAIAISTDSKTRNWYITRWKILAKKLYAAGFNIIIVDKKIHWKDKNMVFFNNHTIRELFSLISSVDDVITLDSGTLHIAAAFNKTTLAIFGPTDPEIICVFPNLTYIWKKLSCTPCWYDRCENKYCLNLISVNDIYNKAIEVFK